jgi:hypothetical protein
MSEVPEKKGVFKPGRLVINFAGENEDNPGKFLTKFDPPLEVRIKFTKADYNRATDDNGDLNLRLAFWSEVTNDWVLFTEDKHQFELIFDDSGQRGVGVVNITHWGDPQIAWGP